MPADSALDAGSLANEIIAVIDQEPQVALRTGKAGSREVRLAPRGSGDCQRVDRVRLARLTGGATRARHQPRRHPDKLLTCTQQVALEGARQVPAVLDRPLPLRPPGRPLERDQVPIARRL